MESDIYVQFPSESIDETQESLSDAEKLWPEAPGLKSQNKKVVVILLGWAGAEHKYLSKYSDFYLKWGCITVRYITPLRYHFIETRKLPLLARNILKQLDDLQLSSHPIFFHVFSNGGAHTYSYLLKELTTASYNVPLDIKGTVFDSAPCPRKLQTSYRAMLSIFSHLKSFRYVAAGLVIFLVACQIFWYHLKCAWNFCLFGDSLDALENCDNEPAPLTNWLGRIANMKNHSFLFLYSDCDSLIPVDQVERFAGIAASRGSNVEKVRFVGSEHVMHFRRYPKEYTKAVKDFIRSAMIKPRGKTIIPNDD